jgi:hypothetical protein
MCAKCDTARFRAATARERCSDRLPSRDRKGAEFATGHMEDVNVD